MKTSHKNEIKNTVAKSPKFSENEFSY